jgi:hypothetical protein
MAMGATKASNADLARLESVVALAGCALICTHQSAEEFHSALIREYLSFFRGDARNSRRRFYLVLSSTPAPHPTA